MEKLFFIQCIENAFSQSRCGHCKLSFVLGYHRGTDEQQFVAKIFCLVFARDLLSTAFRAYKIESTEPLCRVP